MTLLKNAQVLHLYRSLIREAEHFPQYNFRMYALRKIRDTFEQQDMDNTNVPELLKRGNEELERLRRMSTVARLYAHDFSVIEQKENDK
jgi:hypothetical protein